MYLADLSEEGSVRHISCAACGKSETISIMRLRTLIDLAQRIINADERGSLGTFHPPFFGQRLIPLQTRVRQSISRV